MTVCLRRAALIAMLCAALSVQAKAQYRYPAGYGGWGGWSGPATVAESTGRGMGNFAAGAGAYNEQTAEARSINANTAMQLNDYMYQVNMRNAQTYYKRQADQAKQTEQTGEAVYKRIHDNPSPRDVHSGDALNAILDDLTSPKVYGGIVQAGSMVPVSTATVKQIPFEYAASMITESLNDLVQNGAPDFLLTSPAFETTRTTIRSLVATGRQEMASGGRVTPETLAKFRKAVEGAKTRADSMLSAGSSDRLEVDNYLKGLLGLSKMLQTPEIGQYLRGLEKIPTTNVGQLLTFMHSFNLRFGVAKTGPQQAAYDELYGLLSQLRDQSGAPASNPFGLPPTPPDPKHVSQFFAGMDYSHFGPQPDPHGAPAPPAPGQP